MIFTHQNLISNWLAYLVHVKSTGELISFGFSNRSVQSLVSAKRWAKTTSFLADLWSQSEFRTRQKPQRKTDPKSDPVYCMCCWIYGVPVVMFVGWRWTEWESESTVVLKTMSRTGVTSPTFNNSVCSSSLPDYCCYLTKPMSSDKQEAHLLVV